MPILPPAFSLGYHYSKWDNEISASKVMQWNGDFTKYKIPVDSFWLDIGHTDKFKYFEFDPVRFSEKDLNKMKQEVYKSDRQLVVITDPHISMHHNSKVFNLAML
jgi:alpha-glucosidase (family GH31 glycosyl hydrolase)